MHFVNGTFLLEHDGQEMVLDASDLAMMKVMTPVGRKIHLRHKAKKKLAEDPSDLQASLMLEWFNLPTREWAFRLPDTLTQA